MQNILSNQEYIIYVYHKRNMLKAILKLLHEFNVPEIEIFSYSYEDIMQLYDDLQRFKNSPYALQQWIDCRIIKN